MTTINKILENSDPDFTLKNKYQHVKLWCMENKVYKNKKFLCVCLKVNRKNTCIIIVDAPKIINALIKWLENTVKMCLLLTILRLESFVETGVRDLEKELFF